jgi:hypothetical protein
MQPPVRDFEKQSAGSPSAKRRAEHDHAGAAYEFVVPECLCVFTLQNEPEAPLLVRMRIQSCVGTVARFCHRNVCSLRFTLDVSLDNCQSGSFFDHSGHPMFSLV